MKSTLELLQLVIVVLLVIGEQAKGSEPNQCPSYCTCDLYEHFNRADCSGQRLITPNVEVPSAVELLDLSYNDITTLDNSCFEGLIYMVNLTIAHNALHTIYLDAFSPLRDVKSIDLSYNRLEYFDERIFETNTKLTRLDLSGNKFMSLQNKALLRSTSIRYINLHDAQVSYIYPLTFSEMPALREVDISVNLMITLSPTAFSILDQLESVNLEQNRWICDKSFDVTLESLRKRNVEIKLDSCSVLEHKKKPSSGSHMFERMMAAPPTETVTKGPIPIADVWKPKKSNISQFDKEAYCDQERPSKICQLYRDCLDSVRTVVAGEKITSQGQYSENDLKFVFWTGVSLGVAIVICLVACAVCIKRCLATQKQITQRRAARRAVPITSNAFFPQTPARRTECFSRSLSSPARRIPSSDNQADFATFISRLFERPARHQYRRSINENTSRMIRRLSQSNLFNNRLSQRLGANRSGNSEDVQQIEPLIYPHAIESRRASSNEPQVHRSTEERRGISVESAPPMRPETPPPSYGDVIKPDWRA